MTPAPKLLFADPKGQVIEHPYLLATVRSGRGAASCPRGPAHPAAGGADASCTCPAACRWAWTRRPASWSWCREMKVGRQDASCPTRSARCCRPATRGPILPGEVKADGPMLPQWAYTAAAWGGGRARSPGRIHTDRRTHWDPERYSTPELKAPRRRRTCARFPEQPGAQAAEDLRAGLPLLHQPEHLLRRDEGAHPRLGDVQRALRGLHLGPARGRTARLARADGRRAQRPRRWAQVGRLPPAARAGPRRW